MNAERYLCFGGIEIANPIRTQQYLRRGLARDGRVDVHLCSTDVGPEGAGYVDTYSDLYTGDPLAASDLCCYCGAIDEGPYVAPNLDTAPWFEVTRPESALFLGLDPDSVRVEAVLERTVTRLREGARVGRLRPKPRVVFVTGTAWAADSNGMTYGERWLADVLSGAYCDDGCADADLTFLMSCPTPEVAPEECPGYEPDYQTNYGPADCADAGYVDKYGDAYGSDALVQGGVNRFFRKLIRVGTVDGPVFTPIQGVPECLAMQVSFQLVAGSPWLYGLESSCMTAQSLVQGGEVCCTVSAPEWTRDATTRIVIHAPDTGPDVTGLVITATPSIDGDCPATAIPEACLTYRVPFIPRGGELRIDGARRTVTLLDPTSKREVSALSMLDFDGLFQWLDVPPCTTLCVCVRSEGSGSSAVTVTAIPREI